MTQEQALKEMLKGNNVFLTGKAGTGKTYTLQRYIEQLEASGKRVLKTAPTGIAALLIGGTTLHQAFKIPIPAYGHVPEKLSDIPKPTRDADCIIIEEISMCRNDVFEYVFSCLQLAARLTKKKQQIILCGDFYQLPPVVPKDEQAKLKRHALDASGFCFLTPAWKALKLKFCNLTKVYRTTDAELLTNLNYLREGDIRCLPYFNQKVHYEALPEDFYEQGGVVICSTNANAKVINDEQLERLPGGRFAYQAERNGCTAKEYTADDLILLKPGCRIIFLVNDVVQRRFQNGTVGIVTECYDAHIRCRVGESEFDVYPYEWKTESSGDTKRVLGTFKQLPVKIAYAITMHKTQGQTYERCCVSPSSFADGQLYVALSRVTNGDGLWLMDAIQPSDVRTNETVIKFYASEGKIELPPALLKKKESLKQKAKAKSKKTAKKSTKRMPTKKATTTATKTKQKKKAKATKPTKSTTQRTASSKRVTAAKKQTTSTVKKRTTKKTKTAKTTKRTA